MARLNISAVLIFMLSGISAVTSECAAYPPVDDPLVPLISCKVVIVGGGPGGILASWLLRALGEDVCVVEKADVFNGKLQDIPFSPGNGKPPKVFSQCAQRVNEAQLDIRCIVNELNITLQEQEFEDVIYSRAKLARSSQNFLGPNGAFPRVGAYPNSSITDFETAIYEFALVVSTDIHPVTGKKVSPHPATKCGKYATVEQYLLDIFGSEVTKWLLAMYSFRADLVSPLDVCQYIEFFKIDWNRCCTNFYPVGGWSAILNKIRSQSTNSGVRFFKSSEITCLYKNLNGKYIATMSNGKGWIGDRLMFNGGPIDAVKLGGNIGSLLALSDYINAIKPIEVVTYNAFWPNRFWEAYASKAFHNFRYTTDGRCITRSEYPGHPYVLDVNASRPVYVDDPRCVNEYKTLFDYGGIEAVRAQVVGDLKKMFPGVEIPQPRFDFYHLAKSAWHYMQPWSTAKNITIASIFDWALKPLGDPHFCLVGEPYALGGSGWVHGAYLSAVNCIENNMLDLLPKVKADLVKAKIKYYASGCNGKPTPFPNEIMSIKGVTLPGANLALEGEQNQVAARRLAVTVRTRKEQRERFRI